MILVGVIIITSISNAQKTIGKYKVIKQVQGDLNKDNLPDLVVVSENKNNIDKTSYALEIFFRKEDGSSISALKSYKAILTTEMGSGDSFSDIKIKNGVLSIKNEM
jgi:hypothetical protein